MKFRNTLLLLAVVFLVGCNGEEEYVSRDYLAETEADMSFLDYKNDTLDLIKEFNQYCLDVVNKLSEGNYDKAEFVERSTDMMRYLNSFNTETSTGFDEEAKQYVDSSIFNMKEVTEYTMKYLNQHDAFFIDMINQYKSEIKVDIDMIHSIYY